MADPGSPSLVSPSDGSRVVGNVIVFTFEVPTDSDNDILVFRIELDTNSSIDTESSDYMTAESRHAEDQKTYGHWEVKDGSGNWIDMPTGGVGSTYYGRQARVILRSQDTNVFPTRETSWYWRIGVGDGMSSAPVFNQVIFGQAIFGS